CPFAKSVHVKNQVRYHVSRQQDWNDLSVELEQELSFLAKADPEQVDTTLFILPLSLADFHEYNDFLDWADRLLERMELDGE
ncbi:DUF1415 family protein, partial [Acinetobacter baumannii]